MLAHATLQPISQFCAEQLGLYTYQNYLEVLIFSVATYYSLLWLQKDYTRPFNLYLYGYLALLATSHMIHAQVLFWTIILITPLAALLCITIHQTTIQKMFLQPAPKIVHANQLPHSQWIDILIRSLLLAAHHQKNIFCIITKEQNIMPFLQTPYTLNVDTQPNVIDFLLQSSNLENPSIMVVSQFGIIQTINAFWAQSIKNKLFLTQQASMLQHHAQAAQVFAQATDTITFYINPSTQLATIWSKNTEVQHTSIDQLLSFCKQHIAQSTIKSSVPKKGELYAQKSQFSHTPPPQH